MAMENREILSYKQKSIIFPSYKPSISSIYFGDFPASHVDDAQRVTIINNPYIPQECGQNPMVFPVQPFNRGFTCGKRPVPSSLDLTKPSISVGAIFGPMGNIWIYCGYLMHVGGRTKMTNDVCREWP